MESYLIYKGIKINSGDKIECNIGTRKIYNAKIFVRPETLFRVRCVIGYICQNEIEGSPKVT